VLPTRKEETMSTGATKSVVRATAFAALLIAGCGAGETRAAEVRLLSAAAMQSVFKNVAGAFERTSGHMLVISYGTIGAIAQRVQGGESADVVIGSSLSMPPLVKDGKIDGASLVTVCTTGIGMVVPAPDAVPPLTSADDFIAAVTSAKVVVYADPVRGGAAGVHIGRVLQRLGVADKLKAQITLAAGGDVYEVTLAQGSGALGMTQVSEIVGKPGGTFVGPLPDGLQNYTVFVAGVPTGAAPSQAVRAFIDFLASPTAVAAIKASGMQIE
jgi:molybdate transport system substrate-binding protein